MDRDLLQFLEGQTSFNVVFMQLVPGTKRTTRGWDHFEELHYQRGESRIDLAVEWLRKGYGVGYQLRNRLAAVDADDALTVQRVMDFEEREVYLSLPKVYTPSGGIHAFFVHPPSIDAARLKNHVCHPKEEGVVIPWDFKLGERTMLVAPGTVTPNGIYAPGVWLPPPILDIRMLAPELEIYRDLQDFLRDTRPKRDRIMAAQAYLRFSAPISVDGKGGQKVLRQVAQHLVGYYDLEPGLAFHLMTASKTGRQGEISVMYPSWNARCLGADGQPFPWSDEDLWQALEDAIDSAPAYGISLMEKAVEKEFARWSAASFIEVLTFLPEPPPGIWLTSEHLYQAFLEFSGVPPEAFHKSELSLEVNRAIAQGRLPFVVTDRTHSQGRIFRGLDERTLRSAIDRAAQRDRALMSAA